MLGNKFFDKIIFIILWCTTGNPVAVKKASIITTEGDTPNNQQWSLPFFDNNFGLISNGAAITPSPPRVSIVSTAPPTLSTIIGRTNSINTALAFVSNSNMNQPNSQLPPVPIINPTATSPETIEKPTTVHPIALVVDPNYMLKYLSVVPTITSTSEKSFNATPSTKSSFFVVDPSYFLNYTTGIYPLVSTTATSSTTVVSTTTIPIKSNITTEITETTETTIIPVNVSTTVSNTVATTLSSTVSLNETTSLNNTSSNPLCTSTSSYRPLGLDCDYKSTELVTTESTSENFQIEVPAVIKFDLNITSIPNYIVNLSPVTQSDLDIIEIISSSSNKLVSSIETSSTSASTVNIDLSNTELNIGWRSSSVLPTFATAPPPRNKISQNKCAEYYSTGRRATRTSKVQVFIINGEISKQKEFPHMAALGYGAKNDNQWLCGGSLISENYVVTAAHCLSTKSLGPVQYVRLGTTTLQTETLQSEDYNVIQRIPYPSYVEGRQYDDIALLRLDRSVEFSDYIAPICLHSSTVPDSVKLTATGWGRTTPTGNTAEELRKVELDVVSFYVCQKAYSVASKEELPYGIVENSQICAGSSDGSKDTCQGDSGGPLSLVREGRLYLVGITSFGIGCAKPGIPGVYTRVSHYVPWLEQTVWGQ